MVEKVTAIFVSVIAGVVTHCICKWMDKDK